MNFESQHLLAILPELLVAFMACIVLLLDLYLKPSQRGITFSLTVATLIVGIGITIARIPESTQVILSGSFVHDRLGAIIKVGLLGLAAMILLYSRRPLQHLDMYRGEFFILTLLTILGMMLMTSAGSLLTGYLGLELMSLSLYTMIAMDRDSVPATEGGLKYFILSSLSSGILLYGLSLLYGSSGSLVITEIAAYVAGGATTDPILILGAVFTAVGLAFKIGAVPFHMWLPDVYQGAPSPVTTLLASAPKLAAFALILRIFAEGLGPMAEQWQEMAIILALGSLVIGNWVAIVQTNIKRMLAYSAIAHMGYFLIGIAAAPESGYMPPLLYMLMYTLMGGGAFGLITLMRHREAGREEIEEYRGLSQTHPWMALLMGILMLAMAGIPPTGGFMAKLYIFQAAIEAGYVGLATFGVLMAVVGLFYYLRVVKVMYFDDPQEEPIAPAEDRFAHSVLSINSLAVLGLGILPGPLVDVCLYAVQGL